MPRFKAIRDEYSGIYMKKESKPGPKSGSGARKKATPAAKVKKKERKLYTVTFYHKWCKACGLCSAFCVKQIIKTDPVGVPYIDKMEMDICTGCRFCEIHCPDFAITIGDKHPERRVSDARK
ncbi:MAG: 2-ketoglutarate oxidoreductase subunit delta [Thermodesulfobacteriota bacterium]